MLAETGIAPHRLKLELTESLLMDATPAMQGTMAALKALGVRLHIDDFGTGYSSLAYLQRSDADVLKVDRSFVLRILDDEASAELVRTIVSMASNLGMRVVAEGVENAAQLAQLRALGCEYVQGFSFRRHCRRRRWRCFWSTDRPSSPRSSTRATEATRRTTKDLRAGGRGASRAPLVRCGAGQGSEEQLEEAPLRARLWVAASSFAATSADR